MRYEFLKDFDIRMEQASLFAVITENISSRTVWKDYGFSTYDQVMNLSFAVLMFIMEKELRSEICTMDDIEEFIFFVNRDAFHMEHDRETNHNLSDFIVNEVLSNSGHPMTFQAMDFGKDELKEKTVRYIANAPVDLQGKRRIRYFPSEQGYKLIFATYEVESSIKFDVQEMIFKLHMEKMDYSKAAEDVKNIYNLISMQLKKIQLAEENIRRNVLSYLAEDYEKLVDENNSNIEDIQRRLVEHSRKVTSQIEELTAKIEKPDEEDFENLNQLQNIIFYLRKSIEEHQKIFENHFDFKRLYRNELEKMAGLEQVHRFSLKKEVFDPLMNGGFNLENMDLFLMPLYMKQLPKSYNIGNAFDYDMRAVEEEKDQVMFIEADDIERLKEEREQMLQQKKTKYMDSMRMIVYCGMEKGRLSNFNLSEMDQKIMIPDSSIFKNIMVQLISAGNIQRSKLNITGDQGLFQVQPAAILSEVLQEEEFKHIESFSIKKIDGAEPVVFSKVRNGEDEMDIICSDLAFTVNGEEN